MKVLWISDFNVGNNPGGSQRTDDHIIQEGIKLGHEIVGFNLESDEALLSDEYDLVVNGNLEHLSIKRPHVLPYILEHPNHIRYEHDANSYLTQDQRRELFGTAKKNFFLSKFHHETFFQLYGDIFHDVHIITSPIDIDRFKIVNAVEDREDKVLYLGYMHFLKGTHNFFTHVMRNPDTQFAMAAWGDKNLEHTAKRFKNIEWLGQVAYREMPQLLNRFKTLYYHPAKFEPFCRSVGEALLCGMSLDVTDNIGAVHDFKAYGYDKLQEMCSQSKHRFWELAVQTEVVAQ